MASVAQTLTLTLIIKWTEGLKIIAPGENRILQEKLKKAVASYVAREGWG